MRAVQVFGWAGIAVAVLSLYARCAVQAEAREAMVSLELCVELAEMDRAAADQCIDALARCIETPVLVLAEEGGTHDQ